MSARRGAFDERVRAFRDETAAPADGRATRARVLAAAQAHDKEPRPARRAVLGVVIALAVLLSSAGAFTAIGRWRAATTARRAVEAAPAAVRAPARRVVSLGPVAPPSVQPAVEAPRPAPASAATPAPEPAGPLEEQRIYGRAHKLHFGGGDPRATLAAWDDYLERHPGGAFAPEARYNRALTLLRLGRRAEAIRALRPFAAGAFGAYRREEAALLIESIRGR